MLKTMVLLISVFSLNAMAEPGFLITKTYHPIHSGAHGVEGSARYNFETLMMLFNNSPSATFEESKGVHSGRCFTVFDSKTVAGLLVVAEERGIKKLFTISYDRNEAFFDHYDQYSIQRDRQIFWKQVNSLESADPLVGSSKADDNDSLWQLAKSSSGIVLKATYQGEGGAAYLYGHRYTYISKGEEYGVCIFDKKLQ